MTWGCIQSGPPVASACQNGFPRELPYLKKEFWNAWPKARAKDFAKFVALAKQGKAVPPHRSPDAQAEQDYQKGEIERSLKYCRETLGLGLK